MIEICSVGSGTGVPSPKRASPSSLLRLPQKTVLIDSGPGTMRRLAELGISLHDIDVLAYTHFHPDHIADIVHFFFAARNPQDPRKKPLALFGGPGIHSFYEKLLDLYEGILRPPFPLSVMELEDTQHGDVHFRLFTLPLLHTPHSIGYRFEAEGKVVVFSGDTDVCENLITLARGADLLVLECSFPDALKVQGHLTAGECGQIAQKAGVQKVLLSHFYPPCEKADILGECRRHYKGEVILASDSLRIKV